MITPDRGPVFSERLVAWYDRRGRRDLPWKSPPSPYRVWVSEIMLQQTRVQTVLGYFGRFMDRFPDLGALAAAPLDSVLHLWSGLGYYARARNLHRAACIVQREHGGNLPRTLDALMALPGIGRSTAAAILAQSHGERAVILDGNVRRVLARHAGIDGWPGAPAVERRLWDMAEALTPHARLPDYTQAIMDLGATVCVRARPRCAECPVAADCVARNTGRTETLPAPRPRTRLPVRHTTMLVVTAPDASVLLRRRTANGLWGGLWSLPEADSEAPDAASWCLRHTGVAPMVEEALDTFRHTFSHFHLDITPVRIRLPRPPAVIMEPGQWLWYNVAQPDAIGIAAPVSRLLHRLAPAAQGANP